MTPLHWILVGAVVAPMFVLTGILSAWRWVRSRRKERDPVSDKLLRPPGESVRRHLEKLDEQINDALLWFFFTPQMFAAFLLIPNPAITAPSPASAAVILSIAIAIALAILMWRLIWLIDRRRNYRLGFSGERAVAEELNQLMLDGCRVYHDVPMEPYGNIDHVIVSPTGVYAVETKARRKRKAPGKRDYEVVFDGKTLIFPDGADTRAIEQAKRQADQLRTFLSKALGEPLKVGSILNLSGLDGCQSSQS